jgi:hypothetical protein
MKRRESLLLGLVGGLLALFVGVAGLNVFFVKPYKNLKTQIAGLRLKLDQTQHDREAYLKDGQYLTNTAPRMFATDPNIATAEASKMITDQILRLGLQDSQFSRQPVGPRRVRGNAQEVGWSIMGEGPLSKMVDLIFVLEQTPQLHRIENLVLSAGDQPGRLKARFRYLTLVVEVKGVKPKTDLQPKFALDSPQRRLYDAIVQRDLLRPYVPKPPAEPVAAGPASPLDMLRVVSLTQWGGTPEVHVCEMNTRKILKLRVGDPLAGGQIVMVDYRPLPLPNKPGFISDSRVIVKIGAGYWAVERGQTLSTRYQLAPGQLPTELRGPSVTYEKH